MKNIAQLRHLVARMEGKIISPLVAHNDLNRATKASVHADGSFCFGYKELDDATGPFSSYALHEIMAAPTAMNVATGFSLGILARSQTKKGFFIWLEDENVAFEYGMPYPSGIAAFGLEPTRFVFVRCKSAVDVLKASEDALSEKGVAGVVISLSGSSKALDFTTTRRLHLLAEKAHCPAILLLAKKVLKTSNAATRWQIAAAPSQSFGARAPGLTAFDVTLLRNRAGNIGHWLMQWDFNEQIFKELQIQKTARASLSGTHFSSSANRPSQSGFAA